MTRFRQGLSLLETVFSMAILSVVMLAIFGIFSMGQRSFHFASLRQGLQSEGRKAWTLLKQDLRQSNFVATTARARPASLLLPRREAEGLVSVDRDGLCLPSVRDWASPTAINEVTGFPNFDCYIVYYASEDPEGRFIRQVIQPPTVGPYPFEGFTLNQDPLTNAHRVGNPKILSYQVLSFQARKDEGSRLIRLSVRFRGLGAGKPGSTKKADETFELSLQIYPENTYPRL